MILQQLSFNQEIAKNCWQVFTVTYVVQGKHFTAHSLLTVDSQCLSLSRVVGAADRVSFATVQYLPLPYVHQLN